MADGAASKKRRGRPRKDGSKSANQRTEIAAAAIELFSRQGYAQTTLSSIARAAGLDQSSVYYWFSGKDDILRHLVEMNRSSLVVASGIGAFPDDKPAQLYTVLHEDVLMLCRLPFDFYVLEQAAIAQPDNFADLAADYHALADQVRGIIESGVADGSFVACDAEREAVLALAMDEGVQHRFHAMGTVPGAAAEGGRREGAGGAACENSGAGELALSASEVADAGASATVARLLARETVAEVRARARERKWVTC